MLPMNKKHGKVINEVKKDSSPQYVDNWARAETETN